MPWTFYPVFVATIVSIVGLSHLAVKEHTGQPRTLSDLAAAEQSLLVRFRNILLLCGVLFAITVFGFIVPRSSDAVLVAIFGSLMIGGELLAGVLPARNATTTAHTIMAQVMGVGMLGLAFLFWVGLEGVYSIVEICLALSMCVLSLLTLVDKKRYIAYELAFIFASHFSIITAAIALG